MPVKLLHSTSKKISEGKFYPLGATLRPEGVNFSLFSQSAREVYLLLYDSHEGEPTDVIRLENRTRFTWHCFVHGLKAGQLYAYRVCGDFNPAWGLRFNENKLLTDPYARALTGKFVNRDNVLLAYDTASHDGDLSMDTRDSASCVPRCVVVDDAFDWKGDAHPDIPLQDLVIYEVHAKGFTAGSGVSDAGTYMGVTGKIPYLKELGVNAVEFLPVHEYYVEDFLTERGLTNYWGYNTVGFFAPESSYGTGRYPGCQVEEFKTMVRELHRAGIEVILDVVYNHTAEGNERGPTLSLKGIDNPSYYILTGGDGQGRRYYMNYTGCGNSLNLSSAPALRLVMDSLRYWVEVMHVDGFRFDLASVLGREEQGFMQGGSFFDAVSQDPVLSRVKLIAEPWDLGTYQVGNFPVDWSEWNGRYRDTIRRFVKGDSGQVRELGFRLTGSADLYADDGRSAFNSVNFITCHDGFTLYDLVSYNGKHNDANRENNADGSNDNHSWNCGHEGTGESAEVAALRRKQAKNFLSLLFLSCGTPMLLGGDEFLRTQGGNNNAYCQDNAISWFDWTLLEKNRDIFEFVKALIEFRNRHVLFRRSKFFTGADADSDGMPDIAWYGDGLNRPDWANGELRNVSCLLDGGEIPSDLGDYLLFITLNADYHLHRVALPPSGANPWKRVIDTSLGPGEDILPAGSEKEIEAQDYYLVNPRSVVVLKA